MSLWIYGVLGAVSAEVLFLYRQRNQRPPAYYRDPFFLCVTLAMIMVAGVLVFTYEVSGMISHAVAAFHVGAATPLIVGKALVSPPASPLVD